MTMKRRSFGSLMLACVLVAGCTKTTRSISHSGYPQAAGYSGDSVRAGVSDPAFDYKGELSENDVLGIPRGEITSEADIQRAIEAAKKVNLRPGSSILLI